MKLYASFITLLLSVSLQATENELVASQAEVHSATEVPELNHVLLSIPDQTQKIRLILTAIIQKCNPVAIKNIDHAGVRRWALGLQDILKRVHDLPANSPEHMALKAVANNYCASLIEQATASNLQILPHFDLENGFGAVKQPSDFALLLHYEQKTATILSTLETRVKNLGLSTGNKIARKTEVLFRACANSTPLMTSIALAATMGAAYGLRLWLNGNHPVIVQGNDNTKITLIESNYKTASDFIQNICSGSVAQTATLVGGAIALNGQNKMVRIWNNTKLKAYGAWNYLKGIESVLDAAGYEAIDDNTITFESEELIGLEEQRNDIAPILDCCTDLDDFVRRGNKPQYGTLLIGPSGCGKTMFSRALAGEIHAIVKASNRPINVAFREITCSDLARFTLKDYIADARKQGGVVVLFIDEIHNLAMQTTKNSFQLNEFLTQMSELYNTEVPNSYVFLVAATNQPELLGTSLLVPGRFGKIVRFNYPNATKRADLFAKLLPRAGINPHDIDIASLVRQTGHHVSFGKLRSIINEARIKAEASGELVGQKHLQEAIDSLVHRFKSSVDLNQAQKKSIATYQASKAMTTLLLNSNLHVSRVTIGGINQEVKEINEYGLSDKQDPNKNNIYTPEYGTVITYHEHEELLVDDLIEQEKQCKILLAGNCGQDLQLNTHSAQYSAGDTQKALKLAQEIVLDGKKFEQLSEQRQNEIKDAAEELLKNYQAEVTALLTANKIKLETLIEKLETAITLSGEEIKAILA